MNSQISTRRSPGRTRLALPLLVLVVLGLGYAARHAWIAATVGAGFSAKVACSLHFNSGQDTDAIMRDYIDAELGGLGFLIALDVDAASVTAKAPFGIHARAVYRPGHGCTLLAGLDESEIVAVTERAPDIPVSPPPPPAEDVRYDALAIAAALDAAFREPDVAEPGRLRATTAVVVLHRGRLIAERYAEGYGRSTPMLSWSNAKSVIAAVVGLLVADGELALEAPAPVPEWSGVEDARGSITLDMLLRQSSGLAFDETYGAVNDVSLMLFTAPDMGAFAARMPLAHAPDTFWSYSSGTSNIVSRIVADRFGRSPDALAAYARERLFEPCDIRSAFFEPDGSGTPIGSSFVFMTALDWARFGELHRRDGICGDARRVLPEGWVKYVTTPAPAALAGDYGAHWWLNAGDPNAPDERTWPSLPTDVYAALGHSGQYVLIVPSADLVVVRLGLSLPDDGDDGTEELVAAVLAALPD